MRRVIISPKVKEEKKDITVNTETIVIPYKENLLNLMQTILLVKKPDILIMTNTHMYPSHELYQAKKYAKSHDKLNIVFR